MKPYQLTIEQLLRLQKTDALKGLSSQEAKVRLKQFGANELPEKKPESWFFVFLRQFQSPLIYILLFSAIIMYFVGTDKRDIFIITGIVFFNAFIGTVQEGRSRAILLALRKFIVSESVTIRDGIKQIVNDRDLVPGDLILLQEGERVSADARMIESNSLQIDESMLTGESEQVYKKTHAISGEVQAADQDNMVFKGTYILAGSGKAVVVATGLNTELGKIHTAIETETKIHLDMPLKEELDRLSYWILLFILFFCSVLFVIGAFTGKPVAELLVMIAALFVCSIPEGLPVVFSLVLVSGVYRMAKKNVLVKRMQVVEALGRTNVLVIDKTGTLTRNEMMVIKVCADATVFDVTGVGYNADGSIMKQGQIVREFKEYESLEQLARAASLLNSSEIHLGADGLFNIKGDPTEAALYIFSQKLGMNRQDLEKEYEKIYEIPFESELKFHASFFKKGDKGIVFIAGAPETIFKMSQNVELAQRDCLEQLLQAGLRTVAIGYKEFEVNNAPIAQNSDDWYKDQLQGLNLLGIFGLQDAIRPEVRSIIEHARKAGVEIVMATGDHKKTAVYVAKSVGIYQEGNVVIEGKELEESSDAQLLSRLENITVFARVSPQLKIRIINLYHKKNLIVAMTGDGINDAPSLLAADVGIAMGRIGTQVAKEAADMILLDDSISNIMRAIEEGRHIFYTLRQVVLYFFSTNLGEILMVMMALLAGLPLPITAAQILWLNLVTDGFLDVALSTERPDPGLLHKKWLQQKIRLVDINLILKMLYVAIPMSIGSFWVFYQYYQQDLILARTMTLVVMALFQWFNAWNCRSESRSLFQIGFFSNRWLLLATSFVLLLQIALVNVPFMQALFKTVSLSVGQWGYLILISSSIVFFEEARKFVVRRMQFDERKKFTQ